MKHVSLSVRLAIGHAAAIAALIAVVVVVLASFQIARDQTAAVHDNYIPSIDVAKRLLVRLERMENAEFMYFVSGAVGSAWEVRFDEAARDFHAAFIDAEGMARSPEERGLYAEMARSYGAFMHIDGRMRQLIAGGQVEVARRLNATESLDAAGALRDAARRFYDLNLAESRKARTAADEALGRSARIALLISVAGVLAALAAWRRATRAVTDPIRALERASTALAAGDRRPMAITGVDATTELAALASAFDQMSARLLEDNQALERVVDDRTRALRDANQQLEVLVEELRSLDRMKSNLLAVVSHELLTPINIIMGYADMLADGLGDPPLVPSQRNAVDQVLSASERLTRMVRNALLYARLESGEVTLVGAVCEPSEAIAGAAARAAGKAAAKGVQIAWTAAAEAPAAWADPERLAQVLDELLDNAVHFAATHVEVRATAHRAEVEFEVKDDGPGIDDEALGRIFQPFYQSDLSSTREHGGLGLGLAVAHRLVTRMGGHLLVAASDGRGASFRFTLPRCGRPTSFQPHGAAAMPT